MLYTGCVENRKDPLKLGRCQVRVVGVHTHDKTVLPTEELPWAYPMQPITSAAISGIGYTPLGLVEGTWVVVMFRDDDHQQPIILGSVGGIPQKENKSIEEEQDDVISLDTPIKESSTDEKNRVVGPTSSPVTTSDGGVVTDGNGNPIQTGTKEEYNPSASSKPSATPPSSAKQGIAAVNSAMDSAGITNKYARAAILGIVGGESGWVPQSEGYNYSVQGLQSTFAKTFANKPQLAEKYARWKGSREQFFEFVYAPENNGGSLGNNQLGDGGRYYGRGFLQITGRANYTRYSRLSGVDILTDPNTLNNDWQASAKVTVSYFKDRVKVSHTSNDPSYFQAALTAVGGARSGWPKKEAYYHYFLGEAVPPAQTDKSTKPGEELQSSEVQVAENGIPVDRQKNLVTGFCDPNMKYPLRKYIGEPDTNRLARGRIDGTIVEFKDEKRLTSVETANGFAWNQVDIPYNAKYPYNKVMESESGHVLEFDDTPDNERVHLYHRKGTYTEIDANGTQVNRIVGDGYHIIDRNGYIYIAGECNVTISGIARVLCENDAFIDVNGDTEINLKQTAKLNVANDLEVSVGGQFKLKASNIKLESESDFNVNSSGANLLTSGANFEVNASGTANIEGSQVYLANGAATASASGIGGAIEAGQRSTANFPQLKPPPRNLETEIEYETPEENATQEGKQYHEKRDNEKVNDMATPVQETQPPSNNAKENESGCAAIYTMASLPDSYILHTDKTGYRWTIGAMRRQYNLGSIVMGGKEYKIQDIACNMKNLCENILGPINENIGGVGSIWTITSLYRNNIPQGGSSTSQHLVGQAVDLVMGGNSFAYQLNYDTAVKLASILPYDQLLLEYRDPGVNGNRNNKRINWIHVSYSSKGRRQCLTLLNDKTYKQGLVNLA